MKLVCLRTTRAQLVRQCRELGVERGDIVMVHASLRAVGPILGGPDQLIAAIVEAVGDAHGRVRSRGGAEDGEWRRASICKGGRPPRWR